MYMYNYETLFQVRKHYYVIARHNSSLIDRVNNVMCMQLLTYFITLRGYNTLNEKDTFLRCYMYPKKNVICIYH